MSSALESQHEQNIKKLDHQRDQSLRTMKQQFSKKIQDLINVRDKREKEVNDMLHHSEEEKREKIREMDQACQKQVQELESRLKDAMKEKEAEYRHKVQELSKDLEEAKGHATKAQTELEQTRQELTDAKQEYEEKEKELKHLLQTSKSSLDHDMAIIQNLRKEKRRWEKEKDHLTYKLRETQGQIKTCGEKKDQVFQDARDLKITSKQMREQIADLEAERDSFKQKAANLARQVEDHRDKVQQHGTALKQAEDQLKNNESNHLAMRHQYEDNKNKLKALAQALKDCRSGRAEAETVKREMTEKYQQLREKSIKDMKEREELQQYNRSYRKQLAHEKKKHKDIQDQLLKAEKHLKEHKNQAKEHHEYTSQHLDKCRTNNDNCKDKVTKQETYIQKLEEQIKHLTTQLNNHDAVKRESSRLGDVVSIRDKEVKGLQKKLQELKDENHDLKDVVQHFEKHYKPAHRHLKGKHEDAKKLLKQMQEHHKKLHERISGLQEHTKKHHKKLTDKEEALEKSASRIAELEQLEQTLAKKVGTALYPGEKEKYEAELDHTLQQRNALSKKLEKLMKSYSELYEKAKTLKKENDKLEVIADKYKLDMQHTQKVLESGADLNSQLSKSKKLLQKKEKQYEVLTAQLAALIHRKKVLEERNETLQEKLKYAANPEEVENLNTKLVKCRSEMKTSFIKYEKLHHVTKALGEQHRVQRDKIEALVKALRDTEDIKDRMKEQEKTKLKLQEVLADCKSEQKICHEERTTRLKAMQNVFQQNEQEHIKAMEESENKIQQLQNQLHKAMGREIDIEIESKPKQEEMMQNKAEQYLKHLREERKKLEKALDSDDVHEAAHKSMNNPHMEPVQKLNDMGRVMSREKESEVMQHRFDTNQTKLQLLTQVAPDSNPKDTEQTMRQIEKRGSQREQQSMHDILKVQAIQQRLQTELEANKKLQLKLLHGSENKHKADLVHALQDSSFPVDHILERSKSLQHTLGLKRNYWEQQQRNGLQALQDNRQYMQEMQRALPQFQQLEQAYQAVPFPNVGNTLNRLNQEKTYLVGSMQQENNNLQVGARHVNSIEQKLKKVNAESKQIMDSSYKFGQQPTSRNRQHFSNILQNDASKHLATKYNMSTNKTGINTMFHMHNGQDDTININSDAGTVQQGDTNLVFDDVQHGTTPGQLLNHAQNTAGQAMKKGHDFIVVTYGYELDKDHDASVRYLVFLHAVRTIWKQIQNFAKDNQVNVQLVRITSTNDRYDLLNQGQAVVPGQCTYDTCQSSVKSFALTEKAESFMDKIANELPGNQDGWGQNHSHVVLSLSVPNNNSHIHITDVLYTGDKLRSDELALLDESWITYLMPVMQKKSTKMDMIFSGLPGNDPKNLENRKAILQISERLQNWLTNFRQVKNQV